MLMDMVAKMIRGKDTAGVVHQIPYTTDVGGFVSVIDKVTQKL